MKTLSLFILLVLCSCSKSNIVPKKVYSSIEGNWSIDQQAINYTCTFEIVKGDANYPYYPSNVKCSYNSTTYSYPGISSSQGFIINSDKTMTITLPINNGIVIIVGVLSNSTSTELSATDGHIDVNGGDVHFTKPLIIKRL